MKVSAEEFIKAWQSACTLKDVAAVLGMTLNNVQARASQYRKRGIGLKYYPNKRGMNIESLAALAKSLEPKERK